MEEPSVQSGPTSCEISDSNSSSHFTTHTGGATSAASRFKGVVSQSNGHWGAQIYANHQRIWLGTFKTEREAAMAYDSAAIKLRNGPTHRNYPPTEVTARESVFQNNFTTEAILNMIKDGSYAAKFTDFLMVQDRQGPRLAFFRENPGFNLRQLFQKELTPSDVSKLNRLVIPKKYALKYFPRISDVKEESKEDGIYDLELTFYDRSMNSWKFRYCYWKSSQSFVFTRGWTRFAREKGLRATDRVIFYAYECGDHQKTCVIDVAYNNDGAKGGEIIGASHSKEAILEANEVVQSGFDNHGNGIEKMDMENDNFGGENVKGFEKGSVDSFSNNPQAKGLKLFGVQII